MHSIRTKLLAAALLCAIGPLPASGARAADNDYGDYDALASGLFWARLYGDGGWTLGL